MKYLFLILCMASLNAFAQNYQSQIDDFRKKYKDEFVTDKTSPLKAEDIQYLRFYDADSTYRVSAEVKLLNNEPGFIMPVFAGTGREYVRYALLSFTLKGKPVQLTVYRNISLTLNPKYANYLFLPFTDDTNGKTTYGGGRYIDVYTTDFKDGAVMIDFNKAYNPYCAFSDGYSCPKPPGENAIAQPVEAGEQIYAGEKRHRVLLSH